MNGIVVDIGNTSTSVALVRAGRVGRVLRVASAVRAVAPLARVVARCAGRTAVDGALVASVVPAATAAWCAAVRAAAGCTPLRLTHRLRLGVAIRYPRPATIGADRLANASGAVARYGRPVIVADFGTAVTFDVIDARGAYCGGVIGPGLPLMLDYLAERTALLPRLAPGGPCGRVGRSTAGAMRIGARIGYRGMVREVTAHLRAAPGMGDAALVATGGYAHWALAGSGLDYRIDPTLTMVGLARILALNRERPA